ncbi:hypothetical protein GF327_08660 [Candidatus Woesearchaeota archaeon]|nr:hypothetical protein [Candidatus Woesearchaeota archaeon]
MNLLLNKKSELSVYLIFSVIITVAAIMILFTLIKSKSDITRKIYCRTIYRVKSEKDRYCENYLSLKTEVLYNKEKSIKEFANTKKDLFVDFSEDSNHYADISVFQDSIIENASFKLTLVERIENEFDDGKIQKSAFFSAGGGERSFYVRIPKGEITTSQIELSGDKFPGKVDLVFVIDTSKSMANEWDALCGIISELSKELEKENVVLKTTVYGLGEGETTGDCMDDTIHPDILIDQEPELDRDMGLMTSPIWFRDWGCEPSREYCSGRNPTGKYYSMSTHFQYQDQDLWHRWDDEDEAWAKGAAWAASNHAWRTESKKIVVPISDSDPTGGGPLFHHWYPPPNGQWLLSQDDDIPDDIFTGTEEPAVDSAVQAGLQNNVNIIPIHGDASGGTEGYKIGDPECFTTWDHTCGQIMRWMQRIAQDTSGGNYVAYTNKTALLEELFNVIISPYPENIDFYVNNNLVESYSSKLDQKKSPWIIDFTDEFRACNNPGDICELRIETDHQGAVFLNNLRIKYYLDPEGYEIKIGDLTLHGSSFSDEDDIRKHDFTQELLTAMESYCDPTLETCQIPIAFSSSSDGAIKVQELNIDLKYYSLKEILFQRIIDCWNTAGQGRSKKDFVCSEIVLPLNYKYDKEYKRITETDMTKILILRNWCSFIGNKEHYCGDKDNLRFMHDIFNTYNILLEYDSANKQVVVA